MMPALRFSTLHELVTNGRSHGQDIGRIEDVHWIVTYSSQAPFIYHQTTHGRAFVFGRSDWQYVLNTFAYGCKNSHS